MNLRRPNANEATGTSNRSKSVVPMSGICSSCHDGCKGNCEIWLSSFRGREVLYPRLFGDMTAGADKNYPVDYSHLNIQGYAVGAKGMPEGIEANPDTTIFSNVNTETLYGWESPIKMSLPVFTGALGSTEIARKNWEHFAVGAAISGITIVCGENVCGVDPELELDEHGRIKNSPEMDRRIEVYRRHGHDREKAVRFIVDAAGGIEGPALDIGSGYGFAAVEIARRGVPVTLVDISEDEHRIAWLNARSAGIRTPMEFYLADAGKLPFDDESYPFVSMVNALHHLESVEDVLTEVSRVLAPGGTFLVADFTEEGFAVLDEVHREEGRVHDRPGTLTLDDVAEMLPRYGMACRGRDARFGESVMIAKKM